jgi:hypothetical protein
MTKKGRDRDREDKEGETDTQRQRDRKYETGKYLKLKIIQGHMQNA